MESKKVEFFNKLSFTILLSTIFLSLFFFIPFVPVSLDASKGFLLSIGVTLALFFWLIARLGEGKFVVPKDRLILFAGAIPLVFFASSLFSSSKYVSFFGSGFEMGTFGSMFVLFILFFLSSIYFQTEKKLWYFYSAFFLSATVVAIFEIFNIFIGFSKISPNLLSGITSGNLIGTWNDFALFFGLVILLSVFTIEFLKTKGLLLIMQYFLLISGLLFLVIINLPLVWILVGLFSIIIFVYSISVQQAGVKIIHNGSDKRKFPFTALVVVFISLVFFVGHNSLGGLIDRYVNVPNTDIRPLVSTTTEIAIKAIKHNPFLGTGPNTFLIDWALWQPKQIAQSIFWNVDFNNGFSSILTFVVTTGILGLIAWLLFLLTFFVRGVKSLSKVLINPLSNYFTITTLMISVYSWISLLVFTPNVIMFIMAFTSSGMLLGILVYNQIVPVKNFSFLNDPRNSFFSILGLMVLMILTLSTTYLYAEKFASIIYFSKGSVVSSNTIESFSRSEKMLSNALLLDQNDIYYRALSQVYMGEISLLINDKTISPDNLKSNIQNLVNLAEQSAMSAVSKNPNQYINYMNMGGVYASLVSLSVKNGYENAVSSYNKAQELAPNNPSIPLARATLEIANKNNGEARNFIDQALLLKNNYTDAVFLLAQIETNEGNLPAAIRQAERAGQLTPNDPTVFFRLGLLRYNNSDYSGAVSAFEQAVILDSQYLNARFFLGLAYQKIGRIEDALTQFKLINKVLPDNKEVKDAMNSITNPPPVIDVTPSVDTKAPAKPTKLPLSGQR